MPSISELARRLRESQRSVKNVAKRFADSFNEPLRRWLGEDYRDNAASLAKPATSKFTPTPEDLKILAALDKASELLVLKQIVRQTGLTLKQVRIRMSHLEAALLTCRPGGDRSGRAITDAGRELLKSKGR